MAGIEPGRLPSGYSGNIRYPAIQYPARLYFADYIALTFSQAKSRHGVVLVASDFQLHFEVTLLLIF
jgi:hypothetical protein